MAELIDGKQIAEETLDQVRLKTEEIASYELVPTLNVILVGDNPASNSYVRIKEATARQVGIEVRLEKFPSTATEAEIITKILELNADPKICGIVVQLPLPAQMEKQKVLDAVDPKLDIDCLTTFNKSRLAGREEPFFWPPAAQAVMEILERYSILAGSKKNILIVGSGDLIGKPLSAMFMRRGIEYVLADRKTQNLRELTSSMDVIISGVGKANLITGDMVKKGVVVIDAGTTGSVDGGIVGDVDRETVEIKASILSPVPGGVGPITVAMLLSNAVKAAVRRLKISH